MLALTHAPDWRQRYDITVYQLGWRLGGKAASGRNVEFYGRGEARGTHVWLGGFHHAFALLDQCYRELERPTGIPLRTLDDAVRGVKDLFLGPRQGGGTGEVLPLPARPGTPGDLQPPASIWACVVRMLRWVVQTICTTKENGFHRWIESWPEGRRRRLSSGLRRAARHGLPEYRRRSPAGNHRLVGQLTAATAPERETGLPGNPTTVRIWVAPLLLFTESALSILREQSDMTKGKLGLLELATAITRGIIEDRLYLRRDFREVSGIDFRQWLHRHRARADALDHPAVLGLYDLLLAYRDGDTRNPALAASSALELICRGICDSRGHVLFQFQAGPGEAVFAPIYQLLHKRGVRFQFFHRVKDIAVDERGEQVSRITLGRQVELLDPSEDYQPLLAVDGVPCWPSFPHYDQIVLGHEPLVQELDFESQASPEIEEVVLNHRSDFDHVIYGLPGDLLPTVAGDLLERSPALTATAKHLATTACEGAQFWLDTPWAELRGQVAQTDQLVGCGLPQPLSLFELRTHHLDTERWPRDLSPAQALALVGPLPATFTDNLPAGLSCAKRQSLAGEHIRNHTIRWMQIHISKLWPTPNDDVPPWARLIDPHERRGTQRLGAQFLWANIEPGERQIQSLPNTDHFRLAPGASGFDNLTLAGDWTDTGLNAGCVEAAVVSGWMAAQALGCRTPLQWQREVPGHMVRGRTRRDSTKSVPKRE